MSTLTGTDKDSYINLDSNFLQFRIGKRENSILHCLLALGLNLEEYVTFSIKKELAQMTNLKENECSRLLSTLDQKKIINKRYLRHKHELSIILLPRTGWREIIENPEKKQDDCAGPKKECTDKSVPADDIAFVQRILKAVEKYSRGKNQKCLIAEIDEIIKIFNK